MKQIILASNSPRRKELLMKMDIPFIVKSVTTEEYLDEHVALPEAIEQIAHVKAKAVQSLYPEGIIIGADTVVVNEGKVLGKPHDEQQAKDMLRQLSGKTHQVITGVVVLFPDHEIRFHETTDVTFYPLIDEEIQTYIDTREPFDKAGAYGIQGKGAFLVEKIVGDYYNVMGLPIASLYRRLREYL